MHRSISRTFMIMLFLWCILGTAPGGLFVRSTIAGNDKEPAANGWTPEKTARLREHASSMEKEARGAETPENAQRYGIVLEAMQQRTRRWFELKSVLDELTTSLEKQAALTRELESTKQEIEGFRKNGLPQKPPYTIDFYDQLMVEQDALQQETKASELAMNAVKQKNQQAQERLQQARKQARQLQEKLEEDDSPAAKWRLEGMQLDIELNEARYQLERFNEKNLKTKQQLIAEQNRLLKDQAAWVRKRLQYHQEDLERHEQALVEKRNELQKQLAVLADKKKEADQKWIKSRAEGQSGTPSENMSRRQAALKGLDQWRKAYQNAIEQTTEMLGLVDLQVTAWQKRYRLLKGDTTPAVLSDWEDQSTDNLEALDRLLFLEQQRQNNLWSQINAAEAMLENAADKSRQNGSRTEIKALQQSAAYGMEYLTAISVTRKLERRLKDEIEAKRDDTPIQYRVVSIWTRIKAVWSYELWVIDDRPLTVKKVFVALVILVLGIVITKRLVRRLAEKALRRPQIKATTAAAVEKLLLYTSYVMVVLFALRMVNIPLTAFAFFGGAIAIGLGFGAQNLINNFISGFIIMGEQPISIGDLIEVDGLLGQVEEIGARCTRIRTGENIHILVPNSSFLEKNITNWTLSDRRIRAHVTLGVVYGSPVEQVKALLLEICNEFDGVHKTPEPFVLFTDFGDNALIFEIHFWITVKHVIERRIIESRMRFRIDDVFRQAGIVIAFPQRDVHLDTANPLQVKLLNTE